MKNVLVISLDDMLDVVRYRDAFGVRVRTPALDSLAERGVTFENSFTPVPQCNPARVATMTGRSPFSTDVHHNGDSLLFDVAPVGRTLFGAAKQAGWFAASGGKMIHEKPEFDAARDYLRQGLNELLEPSGYRGSGQKLPGSIGDSPVPESDTKDARTVEWATRFLTDPPQGKPFFLNVGLSRPHLSWDVPKKYYDLYDPDEIEVPEIEGVTFGDLPKFYRNALNFNSKIHDRMVTEDLWKDHVHAYLAAVSFADARIGDLLEAMTEAGRWSDTTVVLWSDHGHHLGDRDLWRKFTLWEEAASIPLIFVDPDVGEPGARISTPASLLDIWPTLSSLAGLPAPRRADGLDLSPLMSDPSAELPRGGVVTSAYGSVSLRTEDWRYTLYNSGEEELFRVGEGQVHGRNLLETGSHDAVVDGLRDLLETEMLKFGVTIVGQGERVRGGPEDDVFVVVGKATAIGEDGDDAYFVTGRGEIVERGGGGEDMAYVAAKGEWKLPRHVEDAVLLSASRASIHGNGADNEIRGNGRSNHLEGGRGRDVLDGGDRRDVLVGGRGNDVLTGGEGPDVFVYETALQSRGRGDAITDFGTGNDKIDLSAIDAREGGRDQAFTWVGKGGLGGAKGELTYRVRGEGEGKRAVVTGDIDGDGKADLKIRVFGDTSLDDGDFIL